MRISDWSSDVCSSDLTMVRQADIAMYHGKDEGRNRHIWFEQGMEMAVQVRNQIETGIRDGMPRGEFIPYFEPKVDIATGRFVGFEMLIRWASPAYGVIPHKRILPCDENSGPSGQRAPQSIGTAEG